MVFEDLTEQIVLIIFGIGMTAGLGFFATLRRCLTKIEKRSFRQSQAMLIMARDADKVTNRLHPQETVKSELLEEIEQLLRGSDGNL